MSSAPRIVVEECVGSELGKELELGKNSGAGGAAVFCSTRSSPYPTNMIEYQYVCEADSARTEEYTVRYITISAAGAHVLIMRSERRVWVCSFVLLLLTKVIKGCALCA